MDQRAVDRFFQGFSNTTLAPQQSSLSHHKTARSGLSFDLEEKI
jgi:hypothetical protein